MVSNKVAMVNSKVVTVSLGFQLIKVECIAAWERSLLWAAKVVVLQVVLVSKVGLVSKVVTDNRVATEAALVNKVVDSVSRVAMVSKVATEALWAEKAVNKVAMVNNKGLEALMGKTQDSPDSGLILTMAIWVEALKAVWVTWVEINVIKRRTCQLLALHLLSQVGQGLMLAVLGLHKKDHLPVMREAEEIIQTQQLEMKCISRQCQQFLKECLNVW